MTPAAAITNARARSLLIHAAVVETLEGRQMRSASDADISFGQEGFANLVGGFLASTRDSVRMTQVGDGSSIVVADYKKAGHWTWLGIAKFDAFGKPDFSFGQGDGFATTAMVASPFHTPAVERAVAMQDDGKIVVAAAAKVPGSRPDVFVDIIAVTRFNADGSVDTGFADNGTARLGVGAGGVPLPRLLQLHVGNDGKITVQGVVSTTTIETDLFLARFDGSGKPDKSLDRGLAASVTRQVTSINAFPQFADDGSIIVARGTPQGVNVLRLKPDGQTDFTFGTNGSTDVALGVGGGEFDVALQPGGKIVVGGWIGQPNAATSKLVRLNLNGTIDPSFGSAGTGIVTGPQQRIQMINTNGDGSIVAVGSTGLLRFDAGGGFDSAFGGDGVLDDAFGLFYDVQQPFSIAESPTPPQLDSEGRILLVGLKTTPDGNTNLGPGVMRIGMDSTEYDAARKRLFIQGTAAGDTVIVDPGSGDDVIVRINGVQTTITGGVVGIHARLGLGGNTYLAGTGVNASMTVTGGGGDTIVAGGGPDTIYGFDGADSITTGAGNDLIANAAYQLHGGGGGSIGLQVDAGVGNDTIYGGGANDVITAGAGDDWISAAAGNDWIVADAGNDFVDAHLGNDSVWGGEGNDAIYGGVGYDVLHGNAGADTIDGGANSDHEYGTGGKDSLLGGDGHDYLRGGYDNDRLFGGVGDDHLFGDRENDVLLGNEGDDDLSDPLGTNYLDGGDGNDRIDGHESFPNALIDTLIGGAGSDIGWYETEDLVSTIETLHLIS